MRTATLSLVSTQCGHSVAEPEPKFELVLARPAVRAIQTKLPEAVAAAVVEFVTGPLIENPHRVGKPLRGELSGLHSARRGTFRIVYRIDDGDRVVTVLRVGPRVTIYR